jgi:hypothetical protein
VRGKNILWTSIATLVLLSMMTTISFAPTTRVEAAPGSVTGILPGETFTISLDIYNGIGVSSWEVRLRWDPFTLKMVGIAEGTYLKDVGSTFFIYSLSKLGDTVLVGAMVMGDAVASGDGTLFTVAFQCIGAPSTKIVVEPKLYDINVYQLPVDGKDAQVTPSAVAECIEAYPANRRHSLTANGAINTLYATIENRYTSAVTVYARFDGLAMDGTLITLNSAKVLLDPGTSVTLSVNFDAGKYKVGEYSFEARAWFSYNAVLFFRGEKAKTTHFWVLP